MNLQTIQKRIEELQAELLTVSNDLAFLINGEVARTAPLYVSNRHELRVGDVINVPEGNIDDYNVAGSYNVKEIEPSSYEGVLTMRVQDREGDGSSTWIQFERLAGVTKGA